MEESTNTNGILMEILSGHNLSVSEYRNMIWINGTDTLLQAWVIPKEHPPKKMVIQLDIKVICPSRLGQRILVESYAGWGDTFHDANRNAFGKFLLASLHVILAAFVNRDLGEDHVEWERWSDNRHTWEACLGPFLLNEFQKPNAGNLDYGVLLDKLREAFLPQASNQTHWLRCFLGSLDGIRIGQEVLLDNDTWPNGEAILNSFPINRVPGYFSLRHFLIALPTSCLNQ
jgi:hypothetical protein